MIATRSMGGTKHFLAMLVKGAPGGAVLKIERTGEPLAVRLEPAFTSEARKRGLLGRDGLDAGAALIIAPSNAVHTFFMRFPIDLIYTDRNGRVLKIREAVGPWRLSGCLRGFAVVEMAAGSAAQAGLRVGDRLTCARG